MADLFQAAGLDENPERPLADRLRPKSLDEVLGQDHLLGPNGPLRKMVDIGRLPSMILWGPPGTGKSQVVTSLLLNSAWLGKKVLFASKNNKAVDVVGTRVNSLGNRPVLLRLGAKDYQASLAENLTQLLSRKPADDVRGHEAQIGHFE